MKEKKIILSISISVLLLLMALTTIMSFNFHLDDPSTYMILFFTTILITYIQFRIFLPEDKILISVNHFISKTFKYTILIFAILTILSVGAVIILAINNAVINRVIDPQLLTVMNHKHEEVFVYRPEDRVCKLSLTIKNNAVHEIDELVLTGSIRYISTGDEIFTFTDTVSLTYNYLKKREISSVNTRIKSSLPIVHIPEGKHFIYEYIDKKKEENPHYDDPNHWIWRRVLQKYSHDYSDRQNLSQIYNKIEEENPEIYTKLQKYILDSEVKIELQIVGASRCSMLERMWYDYF